MNPKMFVVGLASVMLAAGGEAQIVQLLSQTTILGVQSRIFDSMNTPVDAGEAQLQDNTVGTLQLATNVTATHLEVAQRVASSNSFVIGVDPTQTVLSGSATLGMELAGPGEFSPSYMEMRTFAVAAFSAEFHLTEPSTISFSMATGGPQALVYNSYFDLKRNGTQIFNTIQDSSSPESVPQFSGRLEPGTYAISFSLAANPNGAIGPDISNLLNGQCSVNWSMTLQPAQSTARRPQLSIQHDKLNNRIRLQMTDLDPGRFYIIRRSEELVGGLWPIIGNFSAASDKAAWAESWIPSVASAFYKLESN